MLGIGPKEIVHLDGETAEVRYVYACVCVCVCLCVCVCVCVCLCPWMHCVVVKHAYVAGCMDYTRCRCY